MNTVTTPVPVIEKKKMTPNEVIIRFLQLLNADRRDLVYNVAEDYLSAMSTSGEYYYSLKNLIRDKPKKLMLLESLHADVKRLLINSPVTDTNVFLNDGLDGILRELLIEWENSELFRHHNMSVRHKILLYGETGNGKTTIARHIARLSSLPFIEVNTDNVTDRLVGNGGKNVNNIFNQIQQPCILFWDEFDGIGAVRSLSDNSAGAENARIVNSLLVNMEKLNSNVVFVAATNRREVMDSAVLRRFDMEIEVTPPNDIEKGKYATQLMEYYKIPEAYALKDGAKYKSYAEMEKAFMLLARKYIIQIIKEKS
jgi:SpoVK/Ycf46/Vps4 family AAA+-type ATPase